ncbi:MAG: hypothetical protein IPJ94_09525 [Chloroflexi bacterium]|nr:hypothetical protein [Chloroflexota bacterium]
MSPLKTLTLTCWRVNTYFCTISGRSPIKLIRSNTIATIAGSLSMP